MKKQNTFTAIQHAIQALKTKGQVLGATKYKKTAIAFKKRYGIEIENAPCVFVQDGYMYEFKLRQLAHKGRTMEVVYFNPIIEVGNKFKSLVRNDIKRF